MSYAMQSQSLVMQRRFWSDIYLFSTQFEMENSKYYFKPIQTPEDEMRMWNMLLRLSTHRSVSLSVSILINKPQEKGNFSNFPNYSFGRIAVIVGNMVAFTENCLRGSTKLYI